MWYFIMCMLIIIEVIESLVNYEWFYYVLFNSVFFVLNLIRSFKWGKIGF